jgi:hypothetical protein
MIAAARTRAQERRARIADAEKAYADILARVATPVARQVAIALKAEGFPFTVSTPEGVVRLTSDHRREDFVEVGLDTAAESPRVVVRVRHTRGSRVLDEERPLAEGRPPETVSETDVLDALLAAVAPWLER